MTRALCGAESPGDADPGYCSNECPVFSECEIWQSFIVDDEEDVEDDPE